MDMKVTLSCLYLINLMAIETKLKQCALFSGGVVRETLNNRTTESLGAVVSTDCFNFLSVWNIFTQRRKVTKPVISKLIYL